MITNTSALYQSLTELCQEIPAQGAPQYQTCLNTLAFFFTPLCNIPLSRDTSDVSARSSAVHLLLCCQNREPCQRTAVVRSNIKYETPCFLLDSLPSQKTICRKTLTKTTDKHWLKKLKWNLVFSLLSSGFINPKLTPHLSTHPSQCLEARKELHAAGLMLTL